MGSIWAADRLPSSYAVTNVILMRMIRLTMTPSKKTQAPIKTMSCQCMLDGKLDCDRVYRWEEDVKKRAKMK
jgi:hypothetical protein